MYTPYAAAKFVNAILTEAGLPTIPPQMMYNYTTARVNKGKAPLIGVVETEAGVRIEEDVLKEWTKKYLTKKGVVVE